MCRHAQARLPPVQEARRAPLAGHQKGRGAEGPERHSKAAPVVGPRTHAAHAAAHLRPTRCCRPNRRGPHASRGEQVEPREAPAKTDAKHEQDDGTCTEPTRLAVGQEEQREWRNKLASAVKDVCGHKGPPGRPAVRHEPGEGARVRLNDQEASDVVENPKTTLKVSHRKEKRVATEGSAPDSLSAHSMPASSSIPSHGNHSTRPSATVNEAYAHHITRKVGGAPVASPCSEAARPRDASPCSACEFAPTR
eukprot:2632778-Rhodomonas_salina.2